MLTAEQIVQKQISNAENAAGTWNNALQALTESPMQKAALPESLDKAKRNYSRSIDSGRTAAGLNGVTLADYKTAVAAKRGNYASGIAAARPKLQKFWQKALPIFARLKAAARAMASGTEAERDARAAYVVRELRALKGQMKS